MHPFPHQSRRSRLTLQQQKTPVRLSRPIASFSVSYLVRPLAPANGISAIDAIYRKRGFSGTRKLRPAFPLYFGIAINLDDQPSGAFLEYTEFPSPEPLAPHFLCFWSQTIKGSQGVYEHRVLPDGCIDIVFINHEPPAVAGPSNVPFLARLAAGASITGARLRPGCAAGMLCIPASELVNQNLPIATLKGAMQHIQLDRVLDHSNPVARRSVLAQVLPASMQNSAPFDQAVLAAISGFPAVPTAVSIS